MFETISTDFSDCNCRRHSYFCSIPEDFEHRSSKQQPDSLPRQRLGDLAAMCLAEEDHFGAGLTHKGERTQPAAPLRWGAHCSPSGSRRGEPASQPPMQCGTAGDSRSGRSFLREARSRPAQPIQAWGGSCSEPFAGEPPPFPSACLEAPSPPMSSAPRTLGPPPPTHHRQLPPVLPSPEDHPAGSPARSGSPAAAAEQQPLPERLRQSALTSLPTSMVRGGGASPRLLRLLRRRRGIHARCCYAQPAPRRVRKAAAMLATRGRAQANRRRASERARPCSELQRAAGCSAPPPPPEGQSAPHADPRLRGGTKEAKFLHRRCPRGKGDSLRPARRGEQASRWQKASHLLPFLPPSHRA